MTSKMKFRGLTSWPSGYSVRSGTDRFSLTFVWSASIFSTAQVTCQTDIAVLTELDRNSPMGLSEWVNHHIDELPAGLRIGTERTKKQNLIVQVENHNWLYIQVGCYQYHVFSNTGVMPEFTAETSVRSRLLLWHHRVAWRSSLALCLFKGHELLHGGGMDGAFGFKLFPLPLLMTIFFSLWLLRSGL